MYKVQDKMCYAKDNIQSCQSTRQKLFKKESRLQMLNMQKDQ